MKAWQYRTRNVLAGQLLLVLSFGLTTASSVEAHGPKGHANMKVLPKHLGKKLGKGMKALSKGLGVKCKACHVKGKFKRDDKKSKLATRSFFKAAINEKDTAKRKAALKTLLTALKMDAPKNEALIWSAFEHWHAPHKH